MAYGTVKVDTVTFTYASGDTSTTFSGLHASTTNNLTLSGTASANTFTGTTANFTNTNAQNISVTTLLSGLAITGGTAGFTTVTGTTVTGTTANFVTLSGTTVTGNIGQFTSLTGATTTMTSGVFALGTEPLPSISFVSDPNTGIYSPGADQLAVATNGVARMSVAANGDVTFNHSIDLPNVNTFIKGGGHNVIQVDATRTYFYGGTNGVQLRTADNISDLINITNAGLVGIGTSSPGESLHTTGKLRVGDGGNYTVAAVQLGTSNANGISFPGANILNFITNSTAALTIDASQRVGIGTTSPTGNLHVVGLTGASIIRAVGADAEGNADVEIFSTGSTGNSRLYFSDTAAQSGLIRYSHNTNSLEFSTAGSERVRVDSSGRLLVGTSTSRSTYNAGDAPKFQVESTTAGATVGITLSIDNTNSSELYLAKTRGSAVNSHTIVQNNDNLGILFFGGADGTNIIRGASVGAQVDGTPGANDMPGRLVFSTNPGSPATSPTERMRITAGGDIHIGTQSTSSIYDQTSVFGVNIGKVGVIQIARNNDALLLINRIGGDGNLVLFSENGTLEGTISVSGTTVSYNGAHLSRWSQLPSGAERTEILRGSVLSNIDEMCEWTDEENEQLNRMQVSNVEGDKNVSGVFQCWDDDDDTYTDDFYCAMTGDFIIRIAEGVTVERGDLLMSAGDGTAKPQDDDIIRSKTVAKVTSTNVTCTYEDGSYCVPCVLMAC